MDTVTTAKTTPPARLAISRRRPNGGRAFRRYQDQPYVRAATRQAPIRKYTNGRPMPKPSVICQVATSQPARAQPGLRRSGRYPWRSDQPCPRASMARASAMPPVERMFMWPPCASRQGEKAQARPPNAAPNRPAPS
jgi:hypothetical protein